MKSLEQQFVDWVAKQPANAEYDYGDVENCAIVRGLRELGYPVRSAAGAYWRDTDFVKHPLDGRLNSAASQWPYTFGALTARLLLASPDGEG